VCRLYGFRASGPTKVECTLVHAQNALLIQSRSDRSGGAHADGWGIAYYNNGEPVVERRPRAAFEDLHFGETAERVYARTVIAHVRRATVGEVTEANTHPFRYGCWTFAHNGTVAGFDRIESRLRAETDPALQRLRRGSCDSEQAFFFILSRLARAGVRLDAPGADPDVVAGVLGETIDILGAWGQEAGAEREAVLNFLLTDGRFLAATHRRGSLHWVPREGVHDCEICGIPHIGDADRARYRAVVVASEPISHEAWGEIPDRHVLVVREDLEASIKPFA